MPCREDMVAFCVKKQGILEFLKTRYIVFASLTYLDSFNIYIIGLYSVKSPNFLQSFNDIHIKDSAEPIDDKNNIYSRQKTFIRRANTKGKRKLVASQ
jgi:hypothetical protein